MQNPIPPLLSGALPGPGHALEFMKSRKDLFWRGYRELGPVFALKLGDRNVAIGIGPQASEAILSAPLQILRSDGPMEFLVPISGEVLLSAPPEKYRLQGPLLKAMFGRGHLMEAGAVLVREVSRWVDGLPDQGEVALVPSLERLFRDAGARALLGDAFYAEVGPGFWELFSGLGDALVAGLPTDWPIPRNIRRDRAVEKMRGILRPILEARRSSLDPPRDPLQRLVEQDHADGTPVSIDDLVGFLIGLLLAAHSGTVGQCAWTLIQLLQHPRELAAVRSEIDQTLTGPLDDPRIFSRLTRLRRAVQESLRMQPSIDILPRLVAEPFELCGHRIPVGWWVMATAHVSHFLPEVYTDPDRYDPDRFSEERAEGRAFKHALVTFGGGVHACSGASLAKMEMLIALALLIREMDLSITPEHPKPLGGLEGLGLMRPEPTVLRLSRRRRRPAPPGLSPHWQRVRQELIARSAHLRAHPGWRELGSQQGVTLAWLRTGNMTRPAIRGEIELDCPAPVAARFLMTDFVQTFSARGSARAQLRRTLSPHERILTSSFPPIGPFAGREDTFYEHRWETGEGWHAVSVAADELAAPAPRRAVHSAQHTTSHHITPLSGGRCHYTTIQHHTLGGLLGEWLPERAVVGIVRRWLARDLVGIRVQIQAAVPGDSAQPPAPLAAARE